MERFKVWEEKFWNFLFSGRRGHKSHYRCWLSRGPWQQYPAWAIPIIYPGYYNSLGEFDHFIPQALLLFIQSGLQLLSPWEGFILQYENSWGWEEGGRKELVRQSVAGQPTNPFIPAPSPTFPPISNHLIKCLHSTKNGTKIFRMTNSRKNEDKYYYTLV